MGTPTKYMNLNYALDISANNKFGWKRKKSAYEGEVSLKDNYWDNMISKKLRVTY